MSVAAHHNDWLNLVEVSGPFLALPVLMDALPAGLDKPERELTADLWRAFTEWSDEDHGGASDPAVHEAWVRYVLEHVLEFDTDVLLREGDALDTWTVEVPEHDARLTPDLVIRDPEDEERTARLLVTVVTPGVSVTELPETGWSASPAERMESLLKGVEARLGIVTNGDQWTLVHVAEGENTGFATWYASLWREEPLTLRAFVTLLGMRRFFAVAENETLDALLDRSREDQQGVTTQLGKQVRRAIEILIQQIDRVDHDRDGRLLEGMTEERLYESAVTVMMRLIFLFYAEENDLLLLGDDFYDQNYAASTLREQLQATADESGEEILERFHDAWPRLLSTFRAVHIGVEHEQMRLPAYGGALFDPDRYPFLEGRALDTTWFDETADPLPIDNRTVLHLLNAIQTLGVKVPGGGRENRPLSFRALDVEQIGHVYETLLDHTAVRAEDWIFGLEGTKDKEPEVPLGELEARADDQKELVKYLKDETGRSAGALKKRAAAEEKAVYDRWGQRWTPAFQGDEGTARRATPWGLLVRKDSAEHPVIVPPGRVYVTESERRRSSGTHYTPRSLTEEIITHALEPLVYEGSAEGKDRSDWELLAPDEILELKVCDPACGSGAFLVQACRYLAERLVEAWNEHDESDAPDGHALPTDPEERQVVARRYVADRCLYGVDINPLATEMAKLSLWLVTLQKNRPFTFLDHAVRTGDSLIGVTDLETLETFGVAKGQTQLWSQSWAHQIKAAREAREELRSFSVFDVKDSNAKRALLEDADQALTDLRLIARVIVGIQFAAATGRGELETIRTELGVKLDSAISQDNAVAGAEVEGLVCDLLDVLPDGERVTPFHWVLEFPEAFQRTTSGFDALIGNPPFLGGKRISTNLGTAYEQALKSDIDLRGAADMSAHFIRRCVILSSGVVGVVGSDSIRFGDSRELGLGIAVEWGWQIWRAERKRTWPGEAAVTITLVWLASGWSGPGTLDGTEVSAISDSLEIGLRNEPPNSLEHPVVCSLGSSLYGKGFVLHGDEAFLVESESNYVRPYMSAADFTSTPAITARRVVIDLNDFETEQGAEEHAPQLVDHLRATVAVQREGLKGQIHEHRFWRYWDLRPDLYWGLREEECSQVIAWPRLSSFTSYAMVDSDQVFADSMIVLLRDDYAVLGMLTSSLHLLWKLRYQTDRHNDSMYVVSRCFSTFPFPWDALAEARGLDGAAREYASVRSSWLSSRNRGLTKFYKWLHAGGSSDEWERVRQLREEIDLASLELLGIDPPAWSLDVRDTRIGPRLLPDERAQESVLQALIDRTYEEAKYGAGEGRLL